MATQGHKIIAAVGPVGVQLLVKVVQVVLLLEIREQVMVAAAAERVMDWSALLMRVEMALTDFSTYSGKGVNRVA